MNKNMFSDMVREFAKCAGQTLDDPSMSVENRANRYRLISEEFEEFREAYVDYQMAQYYGLSNKKHFEEKLFKETLDLLYVTFGFAEANGWPVASGFSLVHESNMTKFDPETKNYLMNEKGKVLKSDNYKKPVLSYLLP